MQFMRTERIAFAVSLVFMASNVFAQSSLQWREETSQADQFERASNNGAKLRTPPNVRSSAPGTTRNRVGQPTAAQPRTAQPRTGQPRANSPVAARPRVKQRSTSLQLKHLDWRRFLSSVQGLVGKRLAVRSSNNGERLNLRLPARNAASVDATVDRVRQTITLRGDESTVNQWESAVKELDSKPFSEQEQARLVAVNETKPTSISRLASILRVAMAAGPWAGDMVGMIFQNAPQNNGGQNNNAQNGRPDGNDAEESQPLGPNPAAMQLVQQMAGEGGVLGNVRIEFIEGLDIIVIRGNKRDVDRVVQLINQIEEISAKTEPAIEVVNLQNTESESMAEIVNNVSSEILSARLGNVSITPLVKPNALLLIGRAESVESVKALIAKLDQPVNPDTQIRVFKLEHMPSADAARAIIQFYPIQQQQGGQQQQDPGRTGLAPKVRVISEFRTNAVIVWGSPGDMKEIERMLSELDVPDATAVAEVMVFKLKNAFAEELADLLQLTLRAGEEDRRQGGATATGQNQQPTTISPRSSSLELLKIDAETKEVLRSGILTDVRVAADVRANTLVITAPPEARELLTELVRQLDQLPTAEATVKVFEIENGDASTLRDALEALFAQDQQDGQPAIQTAGSDEESSLVPLRFTVDTRSNSIIATGSESDLAVVYAILTRLDEADVRERESRVYKLSNSPADDVAAAVNAYLDEIRSVQDVAPDALSQFEQARREVVVVSEPISNSLIINATQEYAEKIEKIVEELDAQPPMVMIQVLIAEVELEDTEELGVELGIQDSLLFDRSTVTDALVSPGFNFNNIGLGNAGTPGSLGTRENVAGQALSSFDLGRANDQLGYGGLVLSASSESVSVLLRALQQTRRMEVLTRPMVVTMHNQEAYVLVGEQVPRITNSNITDAGTINTTVLEPVGINLVVTPRISPDGQIVMDILATKSELGNDAEGVPISINQFGDVIRSPRIATTEASTTVSAGSGQTVILGGLITKDRTTLERGVPVLMDVPVLGNLFRFDRYEETRNELLIILTPHIIEDQEEMDRLAMIETERMSWCLSDVVSIHGSVPGGSMTDLVDTEVIYPDLSPSAPKSPATIEDESEVLRPSTGNLQPYNTNPTAPMSMRNEPLKLQPASLPRASRVDRDEYVPLAPKSDGGGITFERNKSSATRIDAPPEPRDDLVRPASHRAPEEKKQTKKQRRNLLKNPWFSRKSSK